MNLPELLSRIFMSLFLLFALGETSDRILAYFQVPSIFQGIAAIASCVGASFPVLTLFKDSE